MHSPAEELSLEQAALETGLAVTTLRNQIYNDKLKARLVERDSMVERGGHCYRVTRGSLHDYLRQREGAKRCKPIAATYQPPKGETMRGISQVTPTPQAPLPASRASVVR